MTKPLSSRKPETSERNFVGGSFALRWFAFQKEELARLGVARISYGPGPYQLAMNALKEPGARLSPWTHSIKLKGPV